MDISALPRLKCQRGCRGFVEPLGCEQTAQKGGGIALTHMLNRAGRIELETTVVKLDEGRYYLVCAAFFEQRLVDHLNHNRDGEEVSVKILSTDGLHLRSMDHRRVRSWPPVPMRICQRRLPVVESQRDRSCRRQIMGVPHVLCRELGWELHIPRDGALAFMMPFGPRVRRMAFRITAALP